MIVTNKNCSCLLIIIILQILIPIVAVAHIDCTENG